MLAQIEAFEAASNGLGWFFWTGKTERHSAPEWDLSRAKELLQLADESLSKLVGPNQGLQKSIFDEIVKSSDVIQLRS